MPGQTLVAGSAAQCILGACGPAGSLALRQGTATSCSPPVCPSVLQAVGRINAAIRRGMPAETLEALMDPAAQLPDVHAPAAPLYQQQLALLQCQHPQVRYPQGYGESWAMGVGGLVPLLGLGCFLCCCFPGEAQAG